MKTKYINEFIVLARTGKYSLAADELYISQPSLTRHIQELELEAGTPLFNRTAKGVELNEAGRIFLEFAEQHEHLYLEYAEKMSNHINQLNESVTVGSVFAMDQYGITDLMTGWRKANPDIRTRLREADSAELLYMLRREQLSYAFLREDLPEEDRDMKRVPITDDHLVCLLPETNPLSKREALSLADLRKETFVYYEQCPLLKNLFLGAGYIPNINFEGVKGRNALNLVRRGAGIMLEFRKQIDDSELGGFAIVDIEPRIQSDISLVYSPQTLSDSGKKFVRYIKSAVAGK